jgi:hypothetical protein
MKTEKVEEESHSPAKQVGSDQWYWGRLRRHESSRPASNLCRALTANRGNQVKVTDSLGPPGKYMTVGGLLRVNPQFGVEPPGQSPLADVYC